MKSLTISICLFAVSLLIPLTAQDAPAPTEAEAPKDLGWPREFKTDTHTVVVFQPQVEEWLDYKTLKMRMAVAVSETGKEAEAVYGGLFLEVTTDVNSEAGQVLLTDRKTTKLVFPDTDDAERDRLGGIIKRAVPDKQELIVSLDRIVAAVAASEQQMQEVKASEEVPPIFVSEEPALLVMFMGEPAFEPLGDTGLLFATNTNWDVFLTTGSASAYYLRVDNEWLTTSDAKSDQWQPVKALPASFSKLPADSNWEETRANIPGKMASAPMKVRYCDRPAELIVIDGKPALAPIPGDPGLMYVKNTESDLFFHTATGTYYYLSSGRWFSAKSLSESWSNAPAELPKEFSEIPEDHEKGAVLASVAGTPAASEAIIRASIPERATVNRAETTLEVTYEGDPQFSAIPGTQGVEFALNSNFDVFRVVNKYYCCQNAVWFVADQALGPWAVCDSVPATIYTIPAEHPKHNVTYVTVYNSTPTTVETGYTSGYTGSYVVRGVVMFGLGYWLAKELYEPNYWYWHCRYHCRPCWYSHGCGAYWHNGHYIRGGSRYYGPYGGAGRCAIYNPRTGGWARSSYAYGPRGSAYSRSAYNPYTNTFGKITRVSTPYGTGTRGVVSRNGNWARGGTYTNQRGSIGGATGSRGGAVIRADKRFGGQGGIAKTPGGDVYVGRNGDIHKLDPKSGKWQTREGKSWKDSGQSQLKRTPATGGDNAKFDTSKRPTPTTRPASRASKPAAQPSQPTNRPSVSKPTTKQLDRQAYSRHRGSQTTQRSTSRRSTPTRRSNSSRRSSPSRGSSRGGRRR